MSRHDEGQEAPPGFVIGLSQANQRELHAQGLRASYLDATGDLRQLPMEIETAFDLGSVTKVLATTTILMQLFDQRLFRLEDSITRFLPDFPHQEITIESLLQHRAGLWEWWPLYVEGRTPESAYHFIRDKPLRYAVNSARHYSDLSFVLLGLVAEKIGVSSLDKLFQELVALPLGLENTKFAHAKNPMNVAYTTFGDSAEQMMLRTQIPYPVGKTESEYSGWRSCPINNDVNDGNSFHVFNGVSGHAGLFSTVEDVLKYSEGLLQSLKGDSFLEREVLRRFLDTSQDENQSLGFMKYPVQVGDEMRTAYGHTGFPGVAFAVIRERDVAVTILSNRLHVNLEPVPTMEFWLSTLELVGRVASK